MSHSHKLSSDSQPTAGASVSPKALGSLHPFSREALFDSHSTEIQSVGLRVPEAFRQTLQISPSSGLSRDYLNQIQAIEWLWPSALHDMSDNTGLKMVYSTLSELRTYSEYIEDLAHFARSNQWRSVICRTEEPSIDSREITREFLLMLGGKFVAEVDQLALDLRALARAAGTFNTATFITTYGKLCSLVNQEPLNKQRLRDLAAIIDQHQQQHGPMFQDFNCQCRL